jgi:hypothetical protein
VVGSVFWPGAIVHLTKGDGHIASDLEALEGRDIVRVQPETTIAGEVEYAFKHILMRDVAYGRLRDRFPRHVLLWPPFRARRIMSGPVELTIVVKVDPCEPMLGAGPTFYEDMIGRRVIAIGNLDTVDPARIGDIIISLLSNAATEQNNGQS